MMTPLVSVIMPVHNGEKHLAEAIESVLTQTFSNFEFLVVDDGSTDNTAQILAEYARRDDRLRIYPQENQGLVASLNRCCRIAKGRYIARMDADDISMSTRLEKQLEYLEAHPEVGILGTWIESTGEHAGGVKWPVPTHPDIVRWSLMFGNCIAHPTVMMRREVVESLDYYRFAPRHNEDYDLWIRASDITAIANVPEVLLKYRLSETSVSSRHAAVQQEHGTKLKIALMNRILKSRVSVEAVEALRTSAEGLPVGEANDADKAADLLASLFSTFTRETRLPRGTQSELALDVLRRLSLLAFSVRTTSKARMLGLLGRSFSWLPSVLTVRALSRAVTLGLWFARYRTVSLESQRKAG